MSWRAGSGRRRERRLDAMSGFANAGLMIPEQVWDSPRSPRPEFRFGEGTGSATPLAWSMAQFIRLADQSCRLGATSTRPMSSRARYAGRAALTPRANADFNFPAREVLERMEAGATLRVTGNARTAGSRAFILDGSGRRELKSDDKGNFSFEMKAARGTSQAVVVVVAPSGATYFQRVSRRRPRVRRA